MSHASDAPVILVTGASSGIGAAIARRLATRGCRLALLARRADRLETLARELDPDGARVLAVAGDLTAEADRIRFVDTAVAHFGRIDGLVNNAGYGQRGPLETVPLADLRANYETNVFSLIGLTQLVIPHLRAAGGGRVVNIGSVAGRIPRPLTSIYDSTKHALEALTVGLRGELKPWGIRVSLVRPGFIASEFVAAADRASEAALQGLGPYEPYFRGHREKSGLLWKLAGQPDDVARAVEHAMLSRYPNKTYATPGHARVFLALRWLLPSAVFERVVAMRRKDA